MGDGGEREGRGGTARGGRPATNSEVVEDPCDSDVYTTREQWREEQHNTRTSGRGNQKQRRGGRSGLAERDRLSLTRSQPLVRRLIISVHLGWLASLTCRPSRPEPAPATILQDPEGRFTGCLRAWPQTKAHCSHRQGGCAVELAGAGLA
jgi:hypothetical protein